MKTIKLFKTEQAWMAESLVDGKPDAEVIGLFQTHILPTAFTAKAKPSDVLAHIAALNPDHKVELKR